MLCYGDLAPCKPLRSASERECHLGERPPSALVGREGWGETEEGKNVIAAFTDADTDIFSDSKSASLRARQLCVLFWP